MNSLASAAYVIRNGFSRDFVSGCSWDQAIQCRVLHKWLLRTALFAGLQLMICLPILGQTEYPPFPEPFCPDRQDDKLILFIHGWMGDARNTWRSFPLIVCGHPSWFGDVDVLVINYPTYLRDPNSNITALASWIGRELESRGYWNKYKKVAIVAHSMGGLIAREVVISESLTGRGKNVDLLVEIATPHDGARLAQIASVLGVSPPLTQEMSRGSSFLQTQRIHWQSLRTRPRTHCFFSTDDRVVGPDSATDQCDHVYELSGWNHRELVKPEEWKDLRYKRPMQLVAAYMGRPQYVIEKLFIDVAVKDPTGTSGQVTGRIRIRALKPGVTEILWGNLSSTGLIDKPSFRALEIRHTEQVVRRGGNWLLLLKFNEELKVKQTVDLELTMDIGNSPPNEPVSWTHAVSYPTERLEMRIQFPPKRPCKNAEVYSEGLVTIGENRIEESAPSLVDSSMTLTWARINPQQGRSYTLICTDW